MDRSRAASLIVQTFSPASEASRPELFAGRETAIELLTESLHDHGAVSVLYGPRGIGKTSLARQLELIARGDTTLLQRLGLGGMSFGVADYFDVIAIDAGSLDQSLAELEAAIAREVRRLSPQPAMREVRRTTKLGIGIKGLSGGTESQYEPTPNEDGLSLLSILRSRLEESLGRPLLAIVDEFDQFSSTPGVANWVHHFLQIWCESRSAESRVIITSYLVNIRRSHAN